MCAERGNGVTYRCSVSQVESRSTSSRCRLQLQAQKQGNGDDSIYSHSAVQSLTWKPVFSGWSSDRTGVQAGRCRCDMFRHSPPPAIILQ